jgi:uncharacterized membrane protein
MSWGYATLKVLHILAVVVAFGTLLPAPVLRRKVLNGSPGGPATVEAWYDGSLWMRRRVSEPAFVLVGVLGVWLAIANPNPDMFSLGWVQLAIGLFLFALIVVLGLQGPLARRCARIVSEMSRVGNDVERASLTKRLSFNVWALEVLTTVSALGLVGMLVLMVLQPGS